MSLISLLLLACAKDPAPPVLKPVFFETGSTQFSSDADNDVIARAVKVLKTSEFHVVVVGLADSAGDPEVNKRLSEERAAAVAKMLKDQSGVRDGRIHVHSVGERLATTETVVQRKVEFVFFIDDGRPIPKVVADSGILRDDRERKADAEN